MSYAALDQLYQQVSAQVLDPRLGFRSNGKCENVTVSSKNSTFQSCASYELVRSVLLQIACHRSPQLSKDRLAAQKN